MANQFKIFNIEDTTVTFKFNDTTVFNIKFNRSWHGGCLEKEKLEDYLRPYFDYVEKKVIPAMANVHCDYRGVFCMELPCRKITEYTSLCDLDLIYALVEAVTGAKRGAGSIPSIVWYAK